MSEHKHFFIFERATFSEYISVCRGCGEVKAIPMEHRLPPSVPIIPDVPGSGWRRQRMPGIID